VELTLKRILALAGDLDNRTSNGSPRAKFRRFLEEEEISREDCERLIEESLGFNIPSVRRFAQQDLLNHLAKNLGYTIRPGQYVHNACNLVCGGAWQNGETVILTTYPLEGATEEENERIASETVSAMAKYQEQIFRSGDLTKWGAKLFSTAAVVERADRSLVEKLAHEIRRTGNIATMSVVSVEMILSLLHLSWTAGSLDPAGMLTLIRPADPLVDTRVLTLRQILGERCQETVNSLPADPAVAGLEKAQVLQEVVSAPKKEQEAPQTGEDEEGEEEESPAPARVTARCFGKTKGYGTLQEAFADIVGSIMKHRPDAREKILSIRSRKGNPLIASPSEIPAGRKAYPVHGVQEGFFCQIWSLDATQKNLMSLVDSLGLKKRDFGVFARVIPRNRKK
jgi:hypothetical protein